MATVTSALGPLSDAAWNADGYAPLRDLVDPATCAAVLDRAGDATRPHHDPVVTALGAALLADLLQTEVVAGSSHLVVTLPGSAGATWGRADGSGGRSAVLRLALTDATLATGCPWVLPGSHRGVEPLGLPVDGAVPVPLAAGDALLAHGALVHRVTDNHSVDATAALVVVFRTAGG
jgi:ectoine hydroxylase-related dioxygenase (phytanoyl-CoA dioxygenase family)